MVASPCLMFKLCVEFNIENPKVDTETETRNPKKDGIPREPVDIILTMIPVDEACGNQGLAPSAL